MRHLRFGIFEAMDAGESRHAQTVMRELGIEYQFAVPQSMLDCWQFWNCVGGPDVLPSFVTEFKADPMQHVGHGLSAEMAKAIVATAAVG